MARFHALILGILMSLLALCAAHAHAEGLRAVTEDSPPFNYRDENGQLLGQAVDVVQAVLQEARLQTDIEVLPWARALALAENKPDTLIFSMARTPEREKRFHWIGPVARLRSAFYALAVRGDILADKPEDLRRWKIGGVHQDFGFELLAERGFQVQPAANDYQNIAKLVRMRVDLILSDETGFAYRCARMRLRPEMFRKVLDFGEISTELYLAASLKTDPQTLAALNKAYAAVAARPQYAEQLHPAP